MSADEMLGQGFAAFGEVLKARARALPGRPAIRDEREVLDWAGFDSRIDKVAARLQESGVGHGDTVAIVGTNAVGYVVVFCAAIRIGAVAVPLASSATADVLLGMIRNCGATHLFVDASVADKLNTIERLAGLRIVSFDDSAVAMPLSEWLVLGGSAPEPVDISPDDAFNIIYSSGTTGSPKGIVHSHAMRLGQLRRGSTARRTPESVTLVSTPLYSNTTLVSVLPTLAAGGCVVLMAKFDARRFCEIAEGERVTHAMLVPVQYQRIMALPDFDSFDLSSFVEKSCTSAPFAAALKADVLARWPGRLVEFYGMTEGGGTCILYASEHPDKLHTVGAPAPGHDIRLIDERGEIVEVGGIGEVVGRSETMMTGYRGLADKTSEAEWHDAEGRRYIRHGDIGRFDEDGFLVLLDRLKDLIISGGFNIYPSDLEAVLRKDPVVADVAVIGIESKEWGETPFAFLVLGAPDADPAAVVERANAALGRMQRIKGFRVVDELPRSKIGKVLKRELRDSLIGTRIPEGAATIA